MPVIYMINQGFLTLCSRNIMFETHKFKSSAKTNQAGKRSAMFIQSGSPYHAGLLYSQIWKLQHCCH